MDFGAKRTGMACKRKLQWPGGQLAEQMAANEETAASPAGAGCWSPEPAAAQQAAAEEQQGEVLLRSPTHDGAVRITSPPESKRARFLDVLDSSSLAGPAAAPAAAAGAYVQHGEDLVLQQLPPAATSSSRRTWELLFDGLHQPGAAVLPAGPAAAATPAAAAAAGMPPAPVKQQALHQARHSRKSACRGPYTASRALHGLAPSDASELQQLRSWLTALEAR